MCRNMHSDSSMADNDDVYTQRKMDVDNGSDSSMADNDIREYLDTPLPEDVQIPLWPIMTVVRLPVQHPLTAFRFLYGR